MEDTLLIGVQEKEIQQKMFRNNGEIYHMFILLLKVHQMVEMLHVKFCGMDKKDIVWILITVRIGTADSDKLSVSHRYFLNKN